MATLLIRADETTGASPGGPSGSEGGRRLSAAERLRWATVCLGFLALTLAQQPGRIVADTKLDLTVDPWGWLDRALTLWDPQGYAGEVQNQAYGYLFPMGPFFGIGQSAGLPGWVVQRLWMALLLSVAFVGVGVLARRLRIGTPTSQFIGALAYALAPRMLMGLGATSIEVLPMAMAPWVLVPLVAGARGGSPRRAAAFSGLAVFCIGGVNAVATSAVLPLAVLWLLTRPAGPRRRQLLGWWIAAVGLATAWWVGPLLLLGRYSPPFLDYIETAAVTTSPTGLLSTLRGTTQWVAYLADGKGPIWPLGWSLVHDGLPILATVLLAAAGLLGLASSRLPERAWLVLGLLAGLALVTMGHLGTAQGLLAGPLHGALDGVLAPMRNLHKFDPVLRLPLALGVVHLVGLLLCRVHRPGGGRHLARAGVLAVVLALVTTVSPAVGGRLSPPTGFESIPGYWQQAADYLAAAQPSGRALLVPASSFGTYIWGTTSDEPMQPLAGSEWTVRSAIPLSAPAHIRMLDAVEERLARGEGSDGLAGYLARAGISHLVVRNDLDSGAAGAARPILVEQALHDSLGIRRVASFGPLVPAESELFGRILDSYLTPPRPAVEVYSVADAAPRAYTTPLTDVVSVVGGPDALLALEDRGLVTDRPAVLVGEGSQALGTPGTTFVSDAQLSRERNYGRTADAVSAGLTADQPRRLASPQPDYSYPGSALAESVVRIDGARLSAASSGSDADSLGGARVGDQPYAAIDGDPTTAWRPANRLGEPQRVWWRIDTDRPITAGSIVLRLAAQPAGGAAPPTHLRISTDGGSRTVPLADTTGPQRIPLPAGATSSLTIGVPGTTRANLALAEVEIPGLAVTRTVVTPAPAGSATAYTFDAANPATSGCATQDGGWTRCSPALVRTAEEPAGIDRVFTTAAAAEYGVTVTAVPRPGASLDALIAAAARPVGPVIEASSVAVPDPRGGPDAALDGDPRTAWVAAADDPRPTLTLTWPEPRTIDRVVVGLAPGTAASLVTAVGVGTGGLEQVIGLDDFGTARFAPVTTDRLVLAFPLRRDLTSYDPYTGRVQTLGLGVSELGLSGQAVGNRAAPVEIPCGQGPVVTIDGVPRQTSLHTTVAALRAMRPLDLQLCAASAGPTGRLSAGDHRFAARSSDTLVVRSATLLRTDAGAGAPAGGRHAVDVGQWDREHRTVRVAGRSEPTLLVVPENVNPGWTATLDGRELATQTVDGWQQGYVLAPGGAGEVVLDFRAGAVYHAALAGGAAAVLVLLVLLLLPSLGTPPPVPRRRRGVGPLVALAAVAGVALIGGGWGLAVLAAATALGAVVRRRGALGALATACLLAAGGVFLTLSEEPATSAVQLLALVAVAAVVASLLIGARRPARSGTTLRHLRRGRSTST
jgi:arabinofuranan 3-O-arabinosyltransferase